MKYKCIISLVVAMLLLLSGCAKSPGQSDATNTEADSIETEAVSDTETQQIISEMFSDRDYEIGYDTESSAHIMLNGNSASCDSNAVIISETTVTITDEGTYIITGSLDDGMIVVDADESDKPQIVFDNASVTSSTSAALYVLEADKVFVTLADGTENNLSNGGDFIAIDDNNIDGAVFSKQDLTFNGSGMLTIESPSAHGIVCKDDLVFTGGEYIVSSASHAIDANDSVRVANAELDITAGKDGIHSENDEDTTLGFIYLLSGKVNVEAEGDGLSAGAYMQLDGGEINVVSGGGSVNGENQSSENYGGFMGGPPGYQYESSNYADEDSVSIKGIKATGDINVNGGVISVDSADDSLHSNSSVNINDGIINLSSGDDGIHADNTLTVNDGTVNISESYEGLEGLNIKINGGEISLQAGDDGLNAAGGTDSSGFGGRGNDQFGGGGPGGGFGGGAVSSNGSITVNGGSLRVQASGDGIDSNGTLVITDGYVEVCGPTSGDTAVLDYDTTAEISGGTFIGTGSYMMAQTFTSSINQGVIAVSVGNQSANTEIVIEDEKGDVVLSHTPALNYQILVFSSPDIQKGETYSLTVGSSSGEIQAS